MAMLVITRWYIRIFFLAYVAPVPQPPHFVSRLGGARAPGKTPRSPMAGQGVCQPNTFIWRLESKQVKVKRSKKKVKNISNRQKLRAQGNDNRIQQVQNSRLNSRARRWPENLEAAVSTK